LDLNNNEKQKFRSWKDILAEVTQDIDLKTCQKVFGVIKKYFGRYEEELRYIICLNDERKKSSQKKRGEYISKFSKELDKLFSEDKENYGVIDIEKSINKIFEGYKGKFRKFFKIQRDEESQRAIGYNLNQEQIEKEENLDGIFSLLTNRKDLEKGKVVKSYKNLKEVKMLFDDLKHFVDIRPIRHWLEDRVRAHVFICILSLLLKRIFEINYLECKSVTQPLEEIAKSKLIKYKVNFSEREMT